MNNQKNILKSVFKKNTGFTGFTGGFCGIPAFQVLFWVGGSSWI